MLLLLSLLGGLAAAAIAAVALVVAMLRAERRARRRLFLVLGLSDETVDLLMARNGDLLTELTLVRLSPSSATGGDAVEPEQAPEGPDTAPLHPQPTIRLVHPVTGEARLPGSARQPYSSRHRRL